MIVAIHQPNYLPWIGYFRKIARCDRFVFLDDAQYTRGGYVNRNLIKTPHGVEWLTVPVVTSGRFRTRICETLPDWNEPWVKRHLRTLEVNYRRARRFDEVMQTIVLPTLVAAEHARSSLAAINMTLARRICEYLRIDTPMELASAMNVKGSATDRLIGLVQVAGGTAYLSGQGGAEYQDADAFARVGIALLYNDPTHGPYEQLWGPFTPNLSVIDLLFNLGRDSAAIVRGDGADAALAGAARSKGALW